METVGKIIVLWMVLIFYYYLYIPLVKMIYDFFPQYGGIFISLVIAIVINQIFIIMTKEGINVRFDKPRHFEGDTIQTDFNFNPENLEFVEKGMTFLEKAQEIIEQHGGDDEVVHSKLDKLMEDILLSHGHVELVNIIRHQIRWYS